MIQEINIIKYIISIIIIIVFAIFVFCNLNIGLADNSDFARETRLYTTKPVGFSENSPSDETLRKLRFNTYYIPDWEFVPSVARPHTSTHFLWMPGACLNYFFFSRETLRLSWVSLPARLLLVTFYAWLVFGILSRYKKVFFPLFVTLLLPVALMLSTREYLAYLNSFYAETGSMIFLLMFVAGMVALKYNNSKKTYLFSFAALLALVTCKASNIYWALIGGFHIFNTLRCQMKWRLFYLSSIMVFCGLVCFLVVSNQIITPTGSKVNRYHSLYYGVLRFSLLPSDHLARFNLAHTQGYVGKDGWIPPGRDFVQSRDSNRISYLHTLSVLCHEPMIILRMGMFALDNMQDVSIDYLGRYSVHDSPTGELSEVNQVDLSETTLEKQRIPLEKRIWLRRDDGLWNIWAKLKYSLFPRGGVLLFTLVSMVVWFSILTIKFANNIIGDLGRVGLLCALAVPIDMAIAILGDGCYELIKHLFLANVLFDISAILFVSSVVMVFVFRAGGICSRTG